VELQSRVKDLQEKGLWLAAITYDAPEVLDAFSRQHGITFPLLSDEGSATIRRYGILNPVAEMALGPNASDPAISAEVQKYVSAVNPSPRMVGIAFPGTFMLDRQGRVTSRFFEEFYTERNTVSSLMLKLGLGAAPVNATKLSTAHLEATTYPSDAAIAPGNRITLTLDVVPRPGMHVYAPGASGYRVITFDLEAQPFVRISPTQYPGSEIYHFAPLNERVPVYQKPFTLRRELVLEATPQARAALKGKDAVTVSGTLQYQACDDRICFNPVSLPLTWTMSLRPLVTARPTAPPR
jgi:peroxiredoxin